MTQKFLRVALVMLTIPMLAIAQGKKDEVVATVGNRKITVEDFNRRFNEVKNTFNPPTKQQFLEDLVRFEVGLAEAEKRNLEKDPIFQERVKAELYKTFLEKELGDRIQKITVSDKEMEEYYKRNPEIRFSHIVIEVKPGATAAQRAEAKKRADEIYGEVTKSKRPFEELVRLYSDDLVTKQTGGDAGFQSRMTLTPNFYDVLSKMRVGETRGLVDTPFGYHIVRVTGRRTFANADKRQIRMAVHNEKRLDLFNDYFDRVKKTYKISTNIKALE
ncbi:MAG: peptidylprolyl isomerase [Bdellovibrionaceae bacterium]|nr:peptidylprolyl isomerase [Pseudobdellovibrionaceae bacterium]